MKTTQRVLIGVAAVLTLAGGGLHADEGEESARKAVGELGGKFTYYYVFPTSTGEDHPYSYDSPLNENDLKALKNAWWREYGWREFLDSLRWDLCSFIQKMIRAGYGNATLEPPSVPLCSCSRIKEQSRWWEFLYVSNPRQELGINLFASKVTDADLMQLSALVPNVAVLDLTYTKVTDAGLGYIKNFKNLKKLYLSSTPVKGETLGELSGLNDLKELKLDYTLVTDAGLAALARLTHLQTLDLSGMRVNTQQDATAFGRVTAKGLAGLNLNDMRELEELILADIKLDRPEGSIAGEVVALPDLAYLKRLRTLNLSGTKLDPAVLSKLCALSCLKELNLSRTDIDGKGLASLAEREMANLKTISLSTTQVTKTVVKTLLQKDKSLDELDLSYTRLTDQDICYLKNSGCLRRVAVLDLSATAVTDDGVKLLNNLPALKELYLSDTTISDQGVTSLLDLNQRLEGLSLSRTNVTNKGLGEVRKFKKLKYLYLEDLPALTDAMAYLIVRDMTSLQSLYIHGTKVTDDGVNQLPRLVPGLKVRR